MTRARDFASRELTARARYIVHARKLVNNAHQPARLSWKIPRWSHNTSAFVSALSTLDIYHFGASLVDFAVEGKRLVGHVKRGLPDATWMRTARLLLRSRWLFTGHGSWSWALTI